MSVLTSSPAFLFNLKPESSFITQSAFKKPSIPKKFRQTTAESSSHRKKSADIYLAQPIKKVKVGHETQGKTSKLTLEEVFNTPSENKKACKGLIIDESIDEGSSLSFISSYTSLDSLDEILVVEDKNDDRLMVCETIPSEPLVIKDDIMSHLNNLLSNNLMDVNQFSFQPIDFLQTLQWEDQNLLKNTTQPLVVLDPVALMKLNEYLQDTEVVYPEYNYSVKNTKGLEEDYSDSYPTPITCIDTGDNLSSNKGASPIYAGLFDSSEEEKPVRSPKKIPNKNKSNKQNKTNKGAKKERPVKVQLPAGSTEEKKVPEKTRVPVDETNGGLTNFAGIHVPISCQAVLPAFEESGERRRIVKTTWNPETVNTQEVEGYLDQLSKIIGNTVTDQEAAIKLLKSFGMNVPMTLEIVEQNQALYKETFRVKVKRLRRNGAI